MWLYDSKFDLNCEQVVCTKCKRANSYLNDKCQHCGASLAKEKSRIENLVEDCDLDFEVNIDEDIQIDKWLNKLEEYFAGARDEYREQKLVVEPIEMMMEQRGYYSVLSLFEKSEELTKCIFQKTSFAVPSKFILKMAERGYDEEIIPYLMLMAEKKSFLAEYKKLMEDLAILLKDEDCKDCDNVQYAQKLVEVAKKIGKQCAATVNVLLLDFDSKYSGDSTQKSQFIISKYREIYPGIVDSCYGSGELTALRIIIRELISADEKLLVDVYTELWDVANGNCDEVLAKSLGASITHYCTYNNLEKTNKFLSENPRVKNSIFSKHYIIPIGFMRLLFIEAGCEDFSRYFALALHNSKFVSCKKNVVELFNILGDAVPDDFASTLVVKKAITTLPDSYREEIDIPFWNNIMLFEDLDEVETIDEVDDLDKVETIVEVEEQPHKEQTHEEQVCEDQVEDLDIDALVSKYLLSDDEDEVEDKVENISHSESVQPADEVLEEQEPNEEDFFAYIFYDMSEIDKKRMGINGPLEEWLVNHGADPYNEQQARACMANPDNWKDEFYILDDDENSDENSFAHEFQFSGDNSEEYSEFEEFEEEEEQEELEEDYFAWAFYDITPEMKKEMGIDEPLADWLVSHGADEYDEAQVRACLADPYNWQDNFNFNENDNSYDDNDYDSDYSNDYDDDYDSDYDDYEDREDYELLAMVSGRRSSYDDDDIALEMDETFEDMMMARGLNPYDPDSYDDF